MSITREVVLTPAAIVDLQLLVARDESRAEICRHAIKLQWWSRDKAAAMDVTVTATSELDLFHARLTDQYGRRCGVSLIFWDDTEFPPAGRTWILVVCCNDDLLTDSTLVIAKCRQETIAEIAGQSTGHFFEEYVDSHEPNANQRSRVPRLRFPHRAANDCRDVANP